MQPFDFTPLRDLTARVVFFPVRHHSPAAARIVRELILRLRPGAVLVEGPSDYNDRLAELYLPHRPPLACMPGIIPAAPCRPTTWSSI